MSVESTNWAWKQDLPGGEKIVLLAIADWTYEDKPMFYSRRRLADRVGITTRALSDNLKRLESRGLLRREERVKENGGRTSSVIWLLLGEEDSSHPPQEDSSHPPLKPASHLETLRKETTEDLKDLPITSDIAKNGRPDVLRLCDLLADAIAAQGVGRRPNPHTKGWHESCRRLLDLDGATERQVEYAIGWVTKHVFWASVIRSMPKLREKWGSVALQIRQEREGVRRGGGARDTAGEDMRRMMRVAEELRERGE